MNRELKFRVWDLQRKYFSSEYDIYCSNGSVSSNGSGIVDPNGHHFIPQQYTGCKDKNGKEICEGDIIHYKFDGASYPKEAQDKLLTCEYDASFGGYTFDCKGGSYYWAEIQGYVEIVGNIFENSELLKQ
jgi:uncharacterized phage protein (TIGR01671 family)